MTERPELLTQTTDEGVLVDLRDEFGIHVHTLTLDADLSIGDLAAHAVEFDLPEGEYAAYQVARQTDGQERLSRLAPTVRLGDLEVSEDGVVTIRFAPALRGAM